MGLGSNHCEMYSRFFCFKFYNWGHSSILLGNIRQTYHVVNMKENFQKVLLKWKSATFKRKKYGKKWGMSTESVPKTYNMQEE